MLAKIVEHYLKSSCKSIAKGWWMDGYSKCVMDHSQQYLINQTKNETNPLKLKNEKWVLPALMMGGGLVREDFKL